MRKEIALGMAIFLLVLAGCAKEQIYRSDPPMKIVSNDVYEVGLQSLKAEGYNYYNRFRFTFNNKTDEDLIFDWSETFYLRNGKKYGHMGWEGLTFEELKEIKEQPEIRVAGRERITSIIFPINLVGWREEGVKMKGSTVEAGFTLTPLPEGENGMSITVRKDGKLVREKILVTITLD